MKLFFFYQIVQSMFITSPHLFIHSFVSKYLWSFSYEQHAMLGSGNTGFPALEKLRGELGRHASKETPSGKGSIYCVHGYPDERLGLAEGDIFHDAYC